MSNRGARQGMCQPALVIQEVLCIHVGDHRAHAGQEERIVLTIAIKRRELAPPESIKGVECSDRTNLP